MAMASFGKNFLPSGISGPAGVNIVAAPYGVIGNVRHPRFVVLFTPTYSSWLNLVERWFAELTERWLRRGSHRSTKELVASIRTWIERWNDDPKPFVGHKTADQILESLAFYCQRINDSER